MIVHHTRLTHKGTQATPRLAHHKSFVYTEILQQCWISAGEKCFLCRHNCRCVLSEDGRSDAEQGIRLTATASSVTCSNCHKDRVRTHHIEEEDVLP